jgi:1,4-alpha-glucan branching enzyme
MRSRGYLALVLHGHLPFVRHPEYSEFLEEDWLFEAISESYLPLLEVFEGLVRDDVPFRLSLVVSPTLAAMLADPLLRRRYLRYLDRRIELSEKEIGRTRGDDRFQPLARMYRTHFLRSRERFADRYEGDLLGALRRLSRRGVLELLTCAATHAFLPLLEVHPEAVAAQIRVGVAEHVRHFGERPHGIWLPECAYTPRVDAILKGEDVRFVVLDTHGVAHATPRPRFGVYAPIFTRAGVAAFGRDPETSRQVWSAKEGYPGDPDYREFYRDIGFDLDYDYIRPYIQPTGERKQTGIKYHRITGADDDSKQPYVPEVARERAAEHAAHFLSARVEQLRSLEAELGRPPIVVAPYDAELFGHWWWEGPQFLDSFLRLAARADGLRLVTPSEYLREHPTHQVCQPALSSWGHRGYAEVWLNDRNDWIYPHLHAAQERMVALARTFRDATGVRERALHQAARELLLAQSSDWAFIIDQRTAVAYAEKRFREHIVRFQTLADQVRNGAIDEGWLQSLEEQDNLFPALDFRVFC